MKNIIESKKQFSEFMDLYIKSDVIILPILKDNKFHSLNNELCALYVKILGGCSYILPFNHEDCINLPIMLVDKLNVDNKKYTLDKKEFNHIIPMKNVVDVNLLNYLNKNNQLNFEEFKTNSHSFFERRYYRFSNVNKIIPITKHMEYCEGVADNLEKIIGSYKQDDVLDVYNNIVLDNLGYIESSGLSIDTDIASDELKKHLSKKGKIFTQYNIYSMTGRPSNRFGGINFAALNKNDGSRKPIKNGFDNGFLLEFDYDAYHLRLIADIIGYNFPDVSVHEYLGECYGVDYDESKALSFKYLYGGIPKEVKKNIDYFSEVDKYIKNKWKQYKSNFWVESDIYNKKIFKKNLSNMNPNKLFNYLIQLAETEMNMNIITKIREFLKDYNSKLVLYLYDSFLFDFDKRDGKDIIIELKNIIEQNGKFPTKVKVGNNYHDMTYVMED